MLLAMVHDDKCIGDSKFMKVGDFVTEMDPEIPVRFYFFGLLKSFRLNKIRFESSKNVEVVSSRTGSQIFKNVEICKMSSHQSFVVCHKKKGSFF